MSSASNPSAWFEHFAKKVGAVSDFGQRAFLFDDEISGMEPDAAMRAFRIVLKRGWTSRNRVEKIALDTAMVALSIGAWREDHRRKSFEAALAAGDRLVSLMVGCDFLYSDKETEISLPVPSYRGDRPLSLGERKSIAKKPERKIIALVLRDPHPSVIEKLLDNPRVTESDVIFVAARKPVLPEVLRQVGCHPKWRLSQRIAFALVSNPYTPLRISLSLLHNLSRAEAMEASTDENLPRPLLDALTELLEL